MEQDLSKQHQQLVQQIVMITTLLILQNQQFYYKDKSFILPESKKILFNENTIVLESQDKIKNDTVLYIDDNHEHIAIKILNYIQK